MNTLTKDTNADPYASVDTVMDRMEIKPTMAMKHGISLEPIARKVYSQTMHKKHKRFKSCDSRT